MDHSTPATQLVKGLKSLVATVQNQSDSVDRSRARNTGRQALVGFEDNRSSYCETDLQSLCDTGCFESVMWLLLNREPPDPEQLADCAAILSEAAVIDRPVAEAMSAVPLQTRPLDLLPLSISLLSCFDPASMDVSENAARSQFWRLMAQLPVLMHASFGGEIEDGRIVFSSDCSDPEVASCGSDLCASWAGRLLQVLRDDFRTVTPTEEHAMNVLMICECITDDRAADQSARFVGSAVTDIAAAWKSSSAVFTSQLRNDPYLWSGSLLGSFDNPAAADQWWHGRSKKSMPFGFSRRPENDRSLLMKEQCRELLGSLPAMVLEASASRLESLIASENLFPTADWTATRLLLLLGVPADRVSVAIGMARLVGWAAHHLDQCERGSAA